MNDYPKMKLRTRTELAQELGITTETLRRRMKDMGIEIANRRLLTTSEFQMIEKMVGQ